MRSLLSDSTLPIILGKSKFRFAIRAMNSAFDLVRRGLNFFSSKTVDTNWPEMQFYDQKWGDKRVNLCSREREILWTHRAMQTTWYESSRRGDQNRLRVMNWLNLDDEWALGFDTLLEVSSAAAPNQERIASEYHFVVWVHIRNTTRGMPFSANKDIKLINRSAQRTM